MTTQIYFFKLFRIAFFFFTCYMFCPYNVIDSFSGFKLTSYHNKAVEDNTRCFQNITEAKISSCFEHCLRNCKCKSFQICGGVCQLCYGGLETLHDQNACSYLNFTVDDKVGYLMKKSQDETKKSRKNKALENQEHC